MDKKEETLKNLQEENKAPEKPAQEELEPLSPFTQCIPLARWQGKTSSILNLPLKKDVSYWFYFKLDDPETYTLLTVQSQKRGEIIFFDADSKKALRAADDSLSWSYYTQGPFQRIESGVWLPIQPTKQGSKPETFIIKGSGKVSYEYDNGTGLVLREIREAQDEKEEKNVVGETKDDPKQETPFDVKLQALKEKGLKEVNPEKTKKSKEDWREAQEILNKLNKNKDMKMFREAIINSNEQEKPDIQGNQIVEAFEEICSIYGFDFEYCRSGGSDAVSLLPLNGMKEAKFTLGIILPELCLYPPELIGKLRLKKLAFCSGIVLGQKKASFTIDRFRKAYLDCSEKNIIKLQQHFHQIIFDLMITLESGLDSLELSSIWEELNPPDFDYDSKRKKIPKGLKGFINFRSTLSLNCDQQEIYFALMKNPPTILNHSDMCIAKKGHLLKSVLEAKYPSCINEEWWTFVTEYKDVIELSLNSTEYFKEAHFNPEEIEAKE